MARNSEYRVIRDELMPLYYVYRDNGKEFGYVATFRLHDDAIEYCEIKNKINELEE